MTRLVYLAHRFPVVTETFTIAEVDGLTAAGLDVRLVSLRPPPDDLPDALRPLAERVEVLAPGRTLSGVARIAARAPTEAAAAAVAPRRALAAVRGAWVAARLRSDDHVHVQFPLEAATVGLYASIAAGAPLSFSGHTYHDLDLMPAKLGRASFVTVGSEYERGLLARRYGDEWLDRIHVRRLGVPPRAARTDAEPWTIVSIGTLTGKKGHAVLLEAVAVLAERGHPVRLEIVGEGPERPKLEAQAERLGISARVQLLGALEQREALERAASAAAFALCCVVTEEGDHDCLPVALMDAMSLGVPCVSTDLVGIPELIEDGVSGLLAPAGDAVGIAERLEALLTDPAAAANIGAAGRNVVRTRFDLETNIAALAALFREHLG